MKTLYLLKLKKNRKDQKTLNKCSINITGRLFVRNFEITLPECSKVLRELNSCIKLNWKSKCLINKPYLMCLSFIFSYGGDFVVIIEQKNGTNILFRSLANHFSFAYTTQWSLRST